ncbi:putative bifunctional diguanylate cyclase/phosphodiesterase [Oleispirillum naphthae]|uniref:putative bifunctional diguanylate cyclase/phosphodiesterase n=1 Tax=Oleispirillum naphthae TaxID=2838853 RepID=UPI0030824712
MRVPAPHDPAMPGAARLWRFGIRGKMWATFGAIALMVIGTTLVSWSSYRETNDSMTRIVHRTLPLMTRLSALAQMSQKMLALTPAVLMANDIAGIERAAATFAAAQVRFAEALTQLESEAALRPDLAAMRADAERIDTDLSLLLSAQRQRIRLAASFAAISDQVDVLHQEYRMLADMGSASLPRERQFLLLVNRVLVGLAEVSRIATQDDLDELQNRLRPAHETMRLLLNHPEMQPILQGAEHIERRLDGIAFGETSLFALRGREIMTRDIAALRLSGISEAARSLEGNINRLLDRMGEQTVAERAETAEKLDRSQSLLMILGFFSSLGSLALAFLYLGHGVLDRLARLGATMRHIAAGDLAHPIDTTSRDELGDMARDLSVFRDAMAEINHIASHDMLTGLGNRAMLDARISRLIAERRGGSLFYFNLDGFREITETFGHATADDVLCTLADRLRFLVRPGDVAARIAGDRFVVAAPDLTDEADIAACAARLAAELRRPIRIEELDLEIDPFAGIARFPGDGAGSEVLLHRADMAMRAGLEDRTHRDAALYTGEIGEAATKRKEIRSDLKSAIERGDFMLHYQPKMRILTGRIEGAEALVRWNHPEKGAISPADFIPLAESSGLILPLGRWILYDSCRQAQEWAENGTARLRIAVNISPVQFLRDDMVEAVRRALDDTGLSPDLLELEITEGVMLHHEENVARRMAALRDMGVRLAIDDFGTGYSSLSYLKKLPVDTLKIDQAFVRAIEPGNDDARICTAIIGLAHDIGLEVVAEGIEWQSHIDFLNAESCDLGQGYFISRPLPAEKMEGFLETWKAERLSLRPVEAAIGPPM